LKRKDLIRQIQQAGWYLKRSGSKHDVYWHDEERRLLTVPRHTEIPEPTAWEIQKQAGLKPG
jgi:mRNA interferase HicA